MFACKQETRLIKEVKLGRVSNKALHMMYSNLGTVVSWLVLCACQRAVEVQSTTSHGTDVWIYVFIWNEYIDIDIPYEHNLNIFVHVFLILCVQHKPQPIPVLSLILSVLFPCKKPIRNMVTFIHDWEIRFLFTYRSWFSLRTFES